MDDGLTMAQLLCSRLCHDLAGPVGGIGAGLELLAEDGSTAGDSWDLVRDSGTQAAARLAFLRLAFGASGGVGPGALDELRKRAWDWFGGGNIALDWPEGYADLSLAGFPVPAVKVLANLILVAGGGLPRGGEVAVRCVRLAEGIGLAVVASGPGAVLRDEVAAVFAGEAAIDSLTPRSVPAFLARRLAASIGAVVEAEAVSEDEVRLAALIPFSMAESEP